MAQNSHFIGIYLPTGKISESGSAMLAGIKA
jgi:hypothetical protein